MAGDEPPDERIAGRRDMMETGRMEAHVHTIIDTDAVNPVLNDILKAELAGVVRYTHYSLVITGPNRLPLVEFMKAQAAESLLHAQQAGEILTGLGGIPNRASPPSRRPTTMPSTRSCASRSATSAGRSTCTARCCR